MSQTKDLTGRRFHRLKVLCRAPAPAHLRPEQSSYYLQHYACQCTCGRMKVIAADSLAGGTTKSCGCLRVEILVARNRSQA